MKKQPTASDDLRSLRRQARRNELRLQIAQQNEALAALRRSGFRDSLEGFYDPSNYFDPRDYLLEVPGWPGGGMPTTRNDRDQGRDFPIFRTEQELAVIRGAARLLTSTNPIAVGILTTLTNYVIGPGFHYAATPRAGSSIVGGGQLAVIANRVIDEFLDENDWLGDLDRELFQRSRVDGEYFLGLWNVGNGHVQARAIEPDQVTEPSNKTGLDEWLGCAAAAGSWTFGAHTDAVDAQAIHGYYVQWTNRDTEWDYFPGGNEPIMPPDGAGLWMEHAKLNVVRSVKRGLSDFFAIQGNLDLARRVLRNMGEGSAVQAAIAWIQETAPGVTHAQTSSATLSRADARYTTLSSQGSRTHTAQHYDPATILKVPNGQKYLPGPLGSQHAPNFITAAEALLRTVAVRWSLPENLVTGTAENNNFASSLVAESPFVKFAESQQQFYARRDRRTLKRVLWFAWTAGRFGDVPWPLIDRALEIIVTPPQIEVRDPEKETHVRAALHAAGILSRKTWSAQECLDFAQEQKNLAAEAAAEAKGDDKSNAAPADSSRIAAAESFEAFDATKHPRGGNPQNRGQFSKVAGSIGSANAAASATGSAIDAAGPTNRAAEIVRFAKPNKGRMPQAAQGPAAAPLPLLAVDPRSKKDSPTLQSRNRQMTELTGNPAFTARNSRIARIHTGAKLPAEIVHAVMGGLKTGAKANVNGFATAIKNVVTLGLSDKQIELIGVTKEDRANGYDSAVAFSTTSGQILIGVGTGGLAAALAKGGIVARSASGALTIYDAAGNAVGVVQGAADAADQGAINLENGSQILGSALGLVGNLAGLKGLRKTGADALTVGRRLGTVMEKADLDDLEKKLLKRPKVTTLARDKDAVLQAKKGDGMFTPYKDGSSTITLKSNPTRFETLHELAHLEHFESLKYDYNAWMKLTKLEREQYAYDALRKSADWSTFSAAERADAQRYIKDAGGNVW